MLRKTLQTVTLSVHTWPTMRFTTKVHVPDLELYTPEKIRNFSIIAHIDHGKSTLADRLLEQTGTITTNVNHKQFLDRLEVERERGITIKAQSVSMFHQGHMLNLIDTPGHVDFAYEVQRSLTACQGCLLVIDASQGVQAQTLANYRMARDAGLAVIPVLNKIDLKSAQIQEVHDQLLMLLDIDPSVALSVSAKLGTGIQDLLSRIVECVPESQSRGDRPLKVLIYDSHYEEFQGVVAHVCVVDGVLKKGDRVVVASSGCSYFVKTVGIFHPDPMPTGKLYAGQVGYMTVGMKSTKEAKVGDTVFELGEPVEKIHSVTSANPTLFAGLYPVRSADYATLQKAVEKLLLNDQGVTVAPETSVAFGHGFRLGFMGILHMEVFSQRLEKEYDADSILTSACVPYKARLLTKKAIKENQGSDSLIVDSPNKFPTSPAEISELIVVGSIITPKRYVDDIEQLCKNHRGSDLETVDVDSVQVMLNVRLPLNEIISHFYDRLKSISNGYASFSYVEHGYTESNLFKLTVLLNRNPCDELSTIVHESKSKSVARDLARRLKETIPRQLIQIDIQVTIGNRVVARETIKPTRKDVTAKCYGGDISRKMKLLKQQQAGKKQMKLVYNVQVPKEAFITVLRKV